MMDELRHFLLVVRHGTFTEAARQAHLSQPALTASIRRLESDLGARLLDRGPSGAKPTAAGRALMPWAEASLDAIRRGRRAVAAVEGLEGGEVHLAAGSTACAVFLPPILHRFRQTYPKIYVTLREAMTEEILLRLERGQADIGIVTTEGADRWMDDELVLVAAPGLEPKELPFLAFPAGTSHRALLDAHFPGVSIAMELSSLLAVRAHAELGLGLALLSRPSVAHALDDGRLVEVPDRRTPVRRTLWLAHAGEERLSPAAHALRGMLLSR